MPQPTDREYREALKLIEKLHKFFDEHSEWSNAARAGRSEVEFLTIHLDEMMEGTMTYPTDHFGRPVYPDDIQDRAHDALEELGGDDLLDFAHELLRELAHVQRYAADGIAAGIITKAEEQ